MLTKINPNIESSIYEMNLKNIGKISIVVACMQFFGATSTFAASVKADQLFDIAGFPVTNSMLTTWIFAAIIILLFRLLIWRGASLVPSCGQQIIESMVEGLRGIFEPLMGKKAFKGAFPLLLGFFAYILIMNWSGLLPIVGSVGEERIATQVTDVAVYQAEGFHLENGEMTKFVPFLRPANTDLNTTLALAIISFCAWIYFVGKYVGLKGFLKDTFGNKADKKEIALPIYFALFFVFFAVGCIDIISILMRLLSLSFRLFGNNFGGEVLLENMHHLAIGLPRWVSWIIPIPFYLLEMLIGLIQAFLFSLLTAVYIGLLTGSEEHE